MPGNEATAAFGYSLHRDEQRGSPVPLDGVPQIPDDANRWISAWAHSAMPPDLEARADDAIEAACWVLINRRIASRSGGRSDAAEQLTEEDWE